MRVQPIARPVAGEHVVAVSPPLTPRVETDWRRRLNLYTGRVLSDTALTTEQEGRAGHLAIGGRARSAGVVGGLEVTLERLDVDDPATGEPTIRAAGFYAISPGMGGAVTGEDVDVPRPLRVAIRDLPVSAPVALLDGVAPEPEPSAAGLLSDDALAPRRLGRPLGELLDAGVALPPAGVLVLQPIVAELIGRLDPDDPCEADARNDAFEDWQLIDGCRLVLYAWPSEWMLLPAYGATGNQWRNRLAYAVYDAERSIGPGRWLPWAGVGVPIALVGFDPRWRPLFADRHAVVRAGGRPRTRTALVPNAGDPFLWQARISQIIEHLADAVEAGADPRQEWRFLPPAGLLPTTTVDPRTGRDDFFPSAYAVEAAPVPIEQLDLAIEASASLLAYDAAVPDQVRVLVPVPQHLYEPRLLVRENVGPEFQAAITAFVGARTTALRRRHSLRGKAEALTEAATGTAPVVPAAGDDPERLEDEGPFADPPFAGGAGHRSAAAVGFHQHFFHTATATLAVGTGGVLFTHVFLDPANPPRMILLQWDAGGWEHRAYWGENLSAWGTDGEASRRPIAPLPATGGWVRLDVPAGLVDLDGAVVTGMAFGLFDGRAAWGPAGVATPGASPVDTVWFTGALPAGAVPDVINDAWDWIRGDDLLAPFEDAYQTEVREGVRVAVPLADLRADLAGRNVLKADELAELDGRGLEPFIRFLEEKVQRADDAIDFGFLRVRTDIYRIRQLVLDNTAATRLATSPALASIARGETAAATQEQLASFYDRLKEATVDAEGLHRGSPGAEERGTVGTNLGGERIAFVARAGGAAGAHLFTESAILRQRPAATASFFDSGTTLELAEGVRLEAAGAEFLTGRPVEERPVAGFFERIVREDAGHAIRVPTPTVDDIQGQAPIVGSAGLVRNVTVAERLDTPKAPEAKDFTTASKHEVVGSLAKLDINLEGLMVPGLAIQDEFDVTSGQPKRAAPVALTAFTDGVRLAEILAEPNPQKNDEAAYFVGGVDLLEHTTATLRVVEGRAAAYRQVIASCRTVLATLRDIGGQVERRLQVVAGELANARHDVAVARTLLAEEGARIAAINGRRDRILAEHVPFLAYHRPRVGDTLLSTPVRAIDPGPAAAPVPACLARDTAIPDELRAMIDFLREAPVRWFTGVPPLLDRLDRLEPLVDLVGVAQLRSQVRFAASAPRQTITPGAFGGAIAQVFAARQQVATASRARTLQLDVARFALGSWLGAREQATDLVSLGDLIDAPSGRGEVARAASRELDGLARVSGCLYAAFGQVVPAIRLVWAERLSQYDAPVNLRNLASLPRWGEIDLLDRREMQALADWLYGRVDAGQTEAVALMDDLVRVCLLLSSHAPVNRIIAGAVVRPATVTEGGRIDLSAVDFDRVRVGMGVRLYAGSEVVAHAVVDDLGAGQVAARVVRVLATETPGAGNGTASVVRNVQLAAGARVQFAEMIGFDGADGVAGGRADHTVAAWGGR